MTLIDKVRFHALCKFDVLFCTNSFIVKNFHCFPGSFPRLRIFKIDVSISFTDLLQAVVKNDNMADCFSCSAW